MGKAYTPNIKSDKGKNLTKYVAEFVKKKKSGEIPRVARMCPSRRPGMTHSIFPRN